MTLTNGSRSESGSATLVCSKAAFINRTGSGLVGRYLPSFVPGLLPVQNEKKVLQLRKTELLPQYFSRVILLHTQNKHPCHTSYTGTVRTDGTGTVLKIGIRTVKIGVMKKYSGLENCSP